MQAATIKDQSYTGPTINPNGDTLERLAHQFRNVRGPDQLRAALKAWGLADEISPRQARFWADTTTRERELFCDLAQVTTTYARDDWASIPAPQRQKLWRAVADAAQWGERLRGRW